MGQFFVSKEKIREVMESQDYTKHDQLDSDDYPYFYAAILDKMDKIKVCDLYLDAADGNPPNILSSGGGEAMAERVQKYMHDALADDIKWLIDNPGETEDPRDEDLLQTIFPQVAIPSLSIVGS